MPTARDIAQLVLDGADPTTEVQAALAIYLAMAGLVLFLFLGVWRNLHRFGRLARRIGARDRRSFLRHGCMISPLRAAPPVSPRPPDPIPMREPRSAARAALLPSVLVLTAGTARSRRRSSGT